MSVVAPSLQSEITRVMRDRAVSRPPLIAWVTLGDGCRVRRVRGAYLRLVAWGCDGRGAGRGPVAAAPERIGGARDRLEQSGRARGGRARRTTRGAPGGRPRPRAPPRA